VQKGIFGPKKEEVAGGWRRLHNEELHNLHVSADIIRASTSSRMRWTERVSRMGEMGNGYNIFVGKPEGKSPLGRHRSRWEYNIIVILGK
jgi:hypothetical protein